MKSLNSRKAEWNRGPVANVATERPSGKAVALLLLGDCMFGRLVNEALETKKPDYPWGNTLPILDRADWRFCNLECVISNRGIPWAEHRKAFHFRSATKNIAVLKAAHINAVSIANNHVMDYGHDALSEMLEILDEAGIVHSGAGSDYDHASRLASTEVRGSKIGILAFTDNEADWEATPDRPGTFYVPTDLGDPRAKNLLNIIQRSRGRVDVLIVSAHWGSNWGYDSPPEHISFAHALVEAGADIVFGHSSHVFRAIEFYNGRPIFYGAGNFIDDYAVDELERNDQSFIHVVEVTDRLPARVCLYPTMIRGCHAFRAEGVHASRIAARMTELCAKFQTPTRWSQERQRIEIELGLLNRDVPSPSDLPKPAGRNLLRLYGRRS